MRFCVDCGSENCPCYLAQTGDCLMCSRLQGKDYCDCNWQGVCIYNEYMQGKGRVNNPRGNITAKIISRREYVHDITVFELEVSKGFAMRCSLPGSYVFLQAEGMPTYYQLPISVMKSDTDRGVIFVAVQNQAAKSKALCEATDSLVVRGVYRNGIIGIGEALKSDKGMLIMSKGIGFAPMVLLLERISDMIGVVVFIDSEKISEDFIADFFPKDFRGEVIYGKISELLSDKFKERREGQFADMTKIALTSEYYIEQLSKVMKISAYSNNFRLCCGEGLCGSCGRADGKGGVVKMCKCCFAIDTEEG